MASSTFGMSGSSAATSLLGAFITITATDTPEVLLASIAIDREQDIEALSHNPQQLAARARPTALGHRLTSCPTSCSRSVRGTHSSSSTRIRDQMPAGLLQRSDRKLPGNRGKVVEKLL